MSTIKVFRGETEAVVKAAMSGERGLWPIGTSLVTIRTPRSASLTVQSVPAAPNIDFSIGGPWVGILEIG
jgi:hypothetical protein